MKQKGPLAVFVSQEKDKRAYRLYRLTIRHTSYLYLIIGKKMQPVQSLKCQLFYVLQIPTPLTPRKDNTGETIATCVYFARLSSGCIRQFVLQLDLTGPFFIQKSALQQQGSTIGTKINKDEVVFTYPSCNGIRS